jgi:DNA polymerase-3 subunit delta'
MKPWFNQSLTQFNKFKDNNHLPHALIISGEKHIGKLEFAQILVNNLTGKNVASDDLDSLDEALDLRKSNYIDLVYARRELNKKTKKLSDVITVDQIRKFNGFITTTSENLKIGVVYYADELHNSAANALLKTLEEPRANTLIILLTHNIKNLPITVVSRCQKIHLSADNSALAWIKENIKISLDDTKILELLTEYNYVPKLVVEAINNENYLLQTEIKTKLIDMAFNPNNVNKIPHADKVELIINTLQHLVINTIKLKKSLSQVNDKNYQKVIENSQNKMLFLLLDDINYAKFLLHTTINQKILVDNLLIIWSHITHLQKYPEIFSTIKE